MVMGLVFAVVLARGSILKAIAMILLGLLLSTVGTDLETGQERMTFGIADLSDGVDFAVLAMGLFGFAEILRNLESPETRDVVRRPIGRLMPSMADLKQSFPPILRGTGLGAILGILPGNGAVLGPFASYTMEKKLAKDPRRFGRGAIEGVAGPESANNAGAQTSFIPLLTLGIPPNAVMALMVGAMTIHGIIPGPQVMTKNPSLFWGMVASMWIGNLMLLIINLPLVGLWVKLLKVPYRLMFPAILIFCCIGIYSINNNPTDVLFTAFFGFVGYVLMKLGFEPAPMLLGFVLGKLMEEKLRQALHPVARQFHHLRRAAGLGRAAGSSPPSCSSSRCCRPSGKAATKFSRNSARAGPRSPWPRESPLEAARRPEANHLEEVDEEHAHCSSSRWAAVRAPRSRARPIPTKPITMIVPVRRRRTDRRHRAHRRREHVAARSASRSSSRTWLAPAARRASPAPRRPRRTATPS